VPRTRLTTGTDTLVSVPVAHIRVSKYPNFAADRYSTACQPKPWRRWKRVSPYIYAVLRHVPLLGMLSGHLRDVR